MNTKEQIIDYWKQQGWHDINAFYDYCGRTKRPDFHVNEDLSPDVTNNRAFWEACEQHFGIDAVANRSSDRQESIEKGNKDNFELFKLMCQPFYDVAIRSILKRPVPPKHIVEIGPGYGSFKENGNIPTDFKYTSFDVYPRIEGCRQIANTNGLFEPSDIEDLYSTVGIVLAVNVYQHLTPKQLINHVSTIHAMLALGGYAIITYTNASDSYMYGQRIKLMPANQLLYMCSKFGFEVLGHNQFYPDIPGQLPPTSYLLKKSKLTFDLDFDS